jgi:integrase
VLGVKEVVEGGLLCHADDGEEVEHDAVRIGDDVGDATTAVWERARMVFTGTTVPSSSLGGSKYGVRSCSSGSCSSCSGGGKWSRKLIAVSPYARIEGSPVPRTGHVSMWVGHRRRTGIDALERRPGRASLGSSAVRKRDWNCGRFDASCVGMEASVVRSGALAAEGELSLRAYALEWLAHARGRVRAKTYEGYEGLFRLYALPALGDVPIGELTPLHLQRLYSGLLSPPEGTSPISAGTVLNLHLVLTQALSQAVRWQLLLSNPASGAQPPRPRRAPRLVVDPELVERLLAETAGTTYELPCALAVSSGMRRGEILALRWTDVADDYSQLQVVRTLQTTQDGLVFEQPKTQRSRRAVVLPAFVAEYLERQRGDQHTRREQVGGDWVEHGLVIDRGDGEPLNPDTLSSGWARFLRLRELPRVRFHDLRHAHATLLLLQGVHPKIVSERLGHASVGITLDTYSHVLPSMQSQAAEAFDALFPATPTLADERP